MRLILGANDLPDSSIKDPVVTWGVFDGVHLGHKDVLALVATEASRRKASSVVITFDRHPATILYDKDVPLLVDLRERLQLIESCGIDYCILIRFTKKFASTTAQDFIEGIIMNKLKASCVVLGYDSRFGHDREGDVKLLNSFNKRLETIKCDVALYKGRPFSSSLIRELLSKGHVEEVPTILGRSYSISGRVVQGDSRGKSIGYPTANIETKAKVIPPTGVYAVSVILGNKTKKGVANIGFRPTFGAATKQIVEVYIIDYKGPDFYGKKIKIEFLFRLRDEKRFNNAEELKQQISQDIQFALSRQ